MTSFLKSIKKATKEQSKLRLAIAGPSGSGKTYSGINILMHLGCERVLVLDTEHGSAAKYSNKFLREFEVIDNEVWQSNFDPRRLIACLREVAPHYDGIFVDSLTHFWMMDGGMLDLVDEFSKQGARGNGRADTFSAWKRATPIYNELIQTILSLPCHFVAGMRSKQDYEDQIIDGKKKKVKVGMAPQMREGFEYEFDVEGQMTMDNDFIVGKSRCSEIHGKTFPKPGANIAKPLLAWLTDGVASQPKQPAAPVHAPAPKGPGVVSAGQTTVVVPNLKPIEIDNSAPEEKAPDTNRTPPVQDDVPKTPAEVAGDLLAQIERAASLAELKAVGQSIKTALDTKLIDTTIYNEQLSKAYSKRQRELKTGGQAAA